MSNGLYLGEHIYADLISMVRAHNATTAQLEHHHMRIRLVRRPGEHGTKRLVAQYGERLLCVRYRYDQQAKKRYKTIELIIETTDWNPKPAPDRLMALRVDFHELDIRRQIKAAGGVWNRPRRVWELRYDQVVALGLTDRIVTE